MNKADEQEIKQNISYLMGVKATFHLNQVELANRFKSLEKLVKDSLNKIELETKNEERGDPSLISIAKTHDLLINCSETQDQIKDNKDKIERLQAMVFYCKWTCLLALVISVMALVFG